MSVYVPERLLIAIAKRRRVSKRAEMIDPGVRLAYEVFDRERKKDEERTRPNAS